jgi:replicative DNA helicase
MEETRLYYETKLIAGIFYNNNILGECMDLNGKYFESEAHGYIFDFFKECYQKGVTITPKALIQKFGDGVKDIFTKGEYLPLSFEVPKIIQSIRVDGQKRFTLEKLKNIIEESKDPCFDVFKAISEIEPYSVEEVKDFKQATLQRLEERMKGNGALSGIASGINEFDEVINGFNNGCLYVCAGRSSMGKSAFMTSAIANIESVIGVGIISLEMTGEELINRICSVRTKIPYWVIDRGKTSPEQFDIVASEINKIKRLQIYDKGGLDKYQICSKIRQMVKDGCKIVFIDHLGLVSVEEKGNLAHSIGKITTALKTLAKELEIPIVILSQVNRATESQNDKRPSLKDLRDSGRIEEDADCVFFLYRDEYYNPVELDGRLNRYEDAEILVEKNRNGACKNVKCHFDNQVMKFY